jgi:hypothetical protein
MKNDRDIEELSAFLDGEASKPETVKRRLEDDADAERMAKDLSALSNQLRRLPAPDVHPAFRTRVMATVRETPRATALPRVTARWQAFAAMVVLAPFAAAIWTFWSPPSAITETNDQQTLVQYLLEQDEDIVLDQLAEMFVDELDTIDGIGYAGDGDYPLETVQETVWLDVLAMDATFATWGDALEEDRWDTIADSISEDELRELNRLLLEQTSGDTTI